MSYRVSVRATATTAVLDRALAQVWNPSTTRGIWLREIAVVTTAAPGAGASLHPRRSTARGTATLTSTPIVNADDEFKIAPPSGFLLDGTFSAEPTMAALPAGLDWVFAAVAASGFIYPFGGRGLYIPAGSGLVLANAAAVIFPISAVSVVVDDP
jgi:hypothetical protein